MTGDIDIFIVANFDAASGSQGLMSWNYQSGSSDGRDYIKIYRGGVNSNLYAAWSADDTKANNNADTSISTDDGANPVLFNMAFYYSGSDIARAFYGNGTNTISDSKTLGSVPLDLTSAYDFLIGRNHNDRFDGDIHEIMVYHRKLSDTERNTVECYLGDKWSITVSGC